MDSSDNKSPTRGSTFIDRVLIRWLKAAPNHPVLVHLAAAALLFVILDIALLYVFNLEPSLSQAIVIGFLIVVTSLVIPPFITFLPLRREILAVIKRVTMIGLPRSTLERGKTQMNKGFPYKLALRTSQQGVLFRGALPYLAI